MKLYNSKQECCGCTACKNICPKKAIKMKTDEEGFLYPKIDEILCIECGLCIDICPFKNEANIKGHFEEPLVYAVKNKSDLIRMLSSSGGIYTAISDYMIERKEGICYGAVFDKEFNVNHKGTNSIEGRDRFRGSKYVQSDLKNIFKEIKQNLIKGKHILFTGTPCQTAGLSKFLEVSTVDTSNLVLNDIICHGTPSPKVWKDYVTFLEKKNKSKLLNYNFRSKEKGWRGYNVKAEFKNGNIEFNTKDCLKYVKLFSSNFVLRPSCYNCKFTNLNRPSDIMIGDFWGIERSLPEFEDKRGVSLILVNTKRGKEIFEDIRNNINYKESNTSDCMQLNLKSPTSKPTNREKFWNDYKKEGFKYISEKYLRRSLYIKIKDICLRILGRLGLLDIVKRILMD